MFKVEDAESKREGACAHGPNERDTSLVEALRAKVSGAHFLVKETKALRLTSSERLSVFRKSRVRVVGRPERGGK